MARLCCYVFYILYGDGNAGETISNSASIGYAGATAQVQVTTVAITKHLNIAHLIQVHQVLRVHCN